MKCHRHLFFITCIYLLRREVRARRCISASFTRAALDAKEWGVLGSDKEGGSCNIEELVADNGCDANYQIP
jgi:hypothetical protein